MKPTSPFLARGSVLLFRLSGGYRRPVRLHPQVRLSFALVIYFILTISVEASCQTPTADPFGSEGRRIYKEQCIACHGPFGRGDGYVLFNPPVADLTSELIQKKLDTELFRSIHQGRPNTMMGSWRLALSDEEMLAVVQYVRQLGKNAGTAP